MSEKLLQQILVEIKGVKSQLDENTRKLDEHAKILEEHTKMLEGHTKMLEGHTKKLTTLDEVKEITLALRDRQEETDARLESMSMDLHQMRGDIAGLKGHASHVKSELSHIKGELAFMSHKTYRNEAAIFKLRRGYDEGFGDLED